MSSKIGFVFLTLILLLISFAKLTLIQPKKLECSIQSTRPFFDPKQTISFVHGQIIPSFQGLNVSLSETQQKVLGIQSQDKSIDIDLSRHVLTAKQGSDTLLTTPFNLINSDSTLKGDYFLTSKFFSTDLSNGSFINSTYYNLPNTPYVLSFGHNLNIVGAYWTSEYGGLSQTGCIEIPINKAEILYFWADVPSISSSPSVKVSVHY